jgi:hypothetical protein
VIRAPAPWDVKARSSCRWAAADSLRVAIVLGVIIIIIIIISFAIAVVFLFFVIWLFAKEEIGNRRLITA